MPLSPFPPPLPLPLRRRTLLLGATASAALAACGGMATAPDVPMDAAQRLRAANRIGWGATQAQLDEIERLGWGRYVERQLKADPRAPMAATIQARIDALGISQGEVAARVWTAESFRRGGDKGATEEERSAARVELEPPREPTGPRLRRRP